MLSEAEKEAKSQVELAQKMSQSIANQLSEITARKRNLKKKVSHVTARMYNNNLHAQL